VRDEQARRVAPGVRRDPLELGLELLDGVGLGDRQDAHAGQVGAQALQAPREGRGGEHPLQGVVRRAGSPQAGRVVVPADGHPGEAGVGELLEPGEHPREDPVRGTGVVEDVAQPQEAVRLPAQGLLDRPVEGPQEVLLADGPALVVAEVGQVGPPQVRVAERDQARHYSAKPFEAPSGAGGSGEGPVTAFR
jgi:hypothetical protein